LQSAEIVRIFRIAPKKASVLAVASVLGFVFWSLGQFLRDKTWVSGLCFYIPSALLGPTLLILGGCYCLRKRARLAGLLAILTAPPLLTAAFVENRWFAAIRRSPTSGDIRIVHWNVGGGLQRSGAIASLLRHRADAYVFSEVSSRQAIDEFQAALGADYQVVKFTNLSVVAKGALEAQGWLLRREGVKVQAVQWHPVGCDDDLTLLVVDLPSSIAVPRDPVLRDLLELVERHHPDIVIGDFNAPRHAYQSVGSGIGYTWPMPAPVLDLDHCLFSNRVTPVNYQLHSTFLSDHRQQVFDFRLN
jgi:vancomycin resistance protein VanJ